MPKVNQLLFYLVLVVIIASIAAIVYLSLTSAPGDRFTEFYLLNREGKAADYPARITVGEPAAIILGVVNHEGVQATYRVQAVVDGAIINSVETGELLNGQKLEKEFPLSLNQAGDSKRIEFYLYMNNEQQPHIKDPLVLVTNVTNPK
jgi:uncharacterized membrane protein